MGKSNDEVTQTTEPWGPQQDYLRRGFQRADQLFQSGGPDFFPDATYVPFAPQTDDALQRIERRALSGSPLISQAQGSLGNILQGGMTGPQQTAVQGLQGLAQTQGGIGQGIGPTMQVQAPGAPQNVSAGGQTMQVQSPGQTMQIGGLGSVDRLNASGLPGVNNVQAQGLEGTSAGYLRGAASGDYLGSNPFLDQMYDRAAGRATQNFREGILPALNASFALSGRGGSDTNALMATRAAGELTDSLADMGADLYGSQYQAERGLQQQAASQLGNMGLQQGSQALQAGLANQGQQSRFRDIAADFGRANQSAGLQERGQNLQAQQSNQSAQSQDLSRGLQASLANQSANAADLSRNLTAQQSNQQAGLQSGDQALRAGLANQSANAADMNRMLQAQQAGANLGLGAFSQMGQFGQQGAQNMLSAAQLSPTLANQDYADLQQLRGVGQEVEAQAGRQLQDQINRFNFYQNRPQQNLQNYIAAIQGNYGGTQTGPGGGSSPIAGALGGASTLGSLASTLGASNPVGWAAAGLGGLLGAFA